MFRSIRKTAANLTGIRGLFSGKDMKPMELSSNLPIENNDMTIYDEEQPDPDIKSIAKTPEKSFSIIKRQKSFDTQNTTMDKYLAEYINKNGLYSNFYDESSNRLTDDEFEAIKMYQSRSTLFNTPGLKNNVFINNLKKVFDKAPKLPTTIYVYRCFSNGVSLNDLNNKENLDIFISTTLSHNLALKWCKEQPTSCYKDLYKNNNIEICIIIPKGTRVLPFVYSYLYKYKEYEILLPPWGRLIDINACHPTHNLPIYIYFENVSEAMQFKIEQQKFINNNNVQNIEEKSWMEKWFSPPENPPDGFDYLKASTEAFGGKKRTNKKRKSRNKIRHKNKTRKHK